MFTTYILYSKSLDRFYVGFTGDDIRVRLSKHLANHSGFTGKVKDWELVYQELFSTKKEAMQREKQIKSWKSNIRIKELIMRNSTE
jgi:putative endonuclease